MARPRTTLPAAVLAAAVVLTATPARATTVPGVTGLTARPGDQRVTLRWVVPSGAGIAGVTVVEKPGGTPPATAADGTAFDAGTATAYTVTGLANGTAYSFGVFARDTAGDFSDPAVVTATPVPPLFTKVSVNVLPRTVTYGGVTVVSATLRRTDTGEPVAGQPVDLYRKPAGSSSYVRTYRVTTNAAGYAAHATAPAKNTQWYAAHPGDPYFAASSSATVASYARTHVATARSKAVVEQGEASIVTVYVAPGHAGQTVQLQRYRDAAWHGIVDHTLNTNSGTTFALATQELGVRTYRVVKRADADHAGSASAPFRIATVRRTLRSGMSGADVAVVEQRLAALHYDVGAVDDYFDYDTLHATAAFQKVNGLPVTGEVDARTYDRLWHAVTPALRYAHTGAWVEIDLTKQALYYARDGAVARILDVSSGSGKYFTVDGETQQAITPMGSFHVFHKIDGSRTSRLGTLWRPAYFAAGGYAIHGNSSVPFYPASHGCVRITDNAMNRLFALLTIGLPVHVYRS